MSAKTTTEQSRMVKPLVACQDNNCAHRKGAKIDNRGGGAVGAETREIFWLFGEEKQEISWQGKWPFGEKLSRKAWQAKMGVFEKAQELAFSTSLSAWAPPGWRGLSVVPVASAGAVDEGDGTA